MADELLSDIIRLENEIQRQLKREQDRAQRWLERVRREEELRVSQTSEGQRENSSKALEKARNQAAAEAAAIERREAELCRQLESFSDNELLEVLKRYLIRVLPGDTDDYQDVQS